MGFFVSLFVIGAGAIARYAVTIESEFVDIAMVGTIAMIIGAVAATASGIDWARSAFATQEPHHTDDDHDVPALEILNRV